MYRLETSIRWIARGLSALILAFWGFFIIAHLLGDAGRPTRPLNATDYILMVCIGGWLIGLASAWKYEILGSITAILFVVVAALLNYHVLLFPGTLVPITAILFLIAGTMRKSSTLRVAKL